MTQDELKQAVADAALAYIQPRLENDTILGIGTGSTANLFIDALARIKGQINGTVASSKASAQRLKSHGIPVYELNTVEQVDFYVDGADESNRALQLIKGGGAALTREKSCRQSRASSSVLPMKANWYTPSESFHSQWKSSPWPGVTWRGNWSSSAATQSTAKA